MSIKTIGASGQISLGKEYAGRTVVIESPEEGVWLIRTAQVIPDDELWLHQEPAQSKLAAGLDWARENPSQASDLEAFEADLRTRWESKHKERLDD